MGREKTYLAVYIVLRKDNQVFLLRRFSTGYQDGNFTVPSGHVDANESALNAAQRELKEEAGVEAKLEDMRLVHTLHRNSTDRVYIDLYYALDNWVGEPKLCEEDKSDEVIWSILNDLPNNTIPDVKESLLNIEKGVPYADIGFRNGYDK